MRLIESINAITSWENYEYQGHVALYIAIKNILDLLQQDKSISGYDLQIEGEEDFSLRKDAKYISLHQVKAGAIKLEENAKFSFVIGILQNEAKYGYFHIANERPFPVDFVSIYIIPIGATLGAVSWFYVMKKDELLDAVNTGSKKRRGMAWYSIGRYVYVPLAIILCCVALFMKVAF